MATILDVAARAGVSRSTVSRVLNGGDRVDELTRSKVLQAMKELGYQPSRIAQSLRKQKTNMISVIIPRISNPYYSILMQGIESETAKQGYNVILCNTDNDPRSELEYLKMIEQHQVDGIILASYRNKKETIAAFESFGPIVMVGNYMEEDLFPTVTVNNVDAAYKASEHLIKLGHRSIGMIAGPSESKIACDREIGFRRAMSRYGLPVVEAWMQESRYGIENGRRYAQYLLTLDNKPSAVFAGNDELAIGVIQEMKNNGLAVPEQLAVVGFDGLQIGTIVEPQLTTVEQPIERMGSLGVALLLQKIKGANVNVTRTNLEAKLVIRKSCGAEARR